MPNAYAQYAAVLLQDNRLVNGSLRLRVKGRSMMPLLSPGDVLTVQQQPRNQLLPGQIVVMVDGGGFLTHRLISLDAETMQTKGDAMRFPDPPASYAALVGVVQTIERSNRVWMDFTQPGWERVWPRLEKLYRYEAKLIARFLPTSKRPTNLQKWTVDVLCQPLRGWAFLLQWMMKK